MKASRVLVGALSALGFSVAVVAAAAQPDMSMRPDPGQMQKNMDKGMCGGMMGMMGSGMMGGGGMMNHGQMMPDLPPGNEKLNLRMHA